MPQYLRIIGLTLTLTFLGVWALAGSDEEPTPESVLRTSFLEWEAGTWDATVTMPDMGGGEPQIFWGEQVERMGACGGWLITDLRMVARDGGTPPPYEGHGVLGFDPIKKKLVGLWIDSNTNWLAAAEGKVDPDGRRLVLHVEGRNPATGQPMDQRYITTRIDENTRKLEIVIAGPGGRDITVATIDYVRRADS